MATIEIYNQFTQQQSFVDTSDGMTLQDLLQNYSNGMKVKIVIGSTIEVSDITRDEVFAQLQKENTVVDINEISDSPLEWSMVRIRLREFFCMSSSDGRFIGAKETGGINHNTVILNLPQ
eukprot:TRINITY_DN2843_c0_g1_i2.p1 TRINITY_DN2843_c0_g1~~TRINITY_DN2843_c0_g1_i2.p1  ORF type:complete len:120 (-),score=14.44 TRINITY_DN2843_c0_g1_i2:422-781(-)